MEKELFAAIRDNYDQASTELWWWFRQKNILLKMIFIFWVLAASITMRIFGFLFSLGIILDKISLWLQSKREWFVNKIEDSKYQIGGGKFPYLFQPIFALILSPIALIFGLIPKWSATLAISAHPDLDNSHGTEYGYFTELGRKYSSLSRAMLSKIFAHGVIFSPIAFAFSLFAVPLLLLVAAIFFALLILDMFGWVVNLIRKFVVSSSENFARSSGKNVFNVILMPTLLTIFVPLYIFLLLIPKIATYEMGQSA